MTKINTIQNRPSNQENNGEYKPIMMLDLLTVIFAINALLSWAECTFSSPTHHDYLKYYAFTNSVKPKNVIILAITLTIIAMAIYAVGLHLNHIWTGSIYFNYAVLFFDVIAITYLISGHFTATNKLSLFNIVLAICFYGLALSYYFSHKTIADPIRTTISMAIVVIISAIASFILKVGIVTFIVYFLVIQLICSAAYFLQPLIQTYIAKKMKHQSMLTANMQAIFYIPLALIDAINAKRG